MLKYLETLILCTCRSRYWSFWSITFNFQVILVFCLLFEGNYIKLLSKKQNFLWHYFSKQDSAFSRNLIIKQTTNKSFFPPTCFWLKLPVKSSAFIKTDTILFENCLHEHKSLSSEHSFMTGPSNLYQCSHWNEKKEVFSKFKHVPKTLLLFLGSDSLEMERGKLDCDLISICISSRTACIARAPRGKEPSCSYFTDIKPEFKMWTGYCTANTQLFDKK